MQQEQYLSPSLYTTEVTDNETMTTNTQLQAIIAGMDIRLKAAEREISSLKRQLASRKQKKSISEWLNETAKIKNTVSNIFTDNIVQPEEAQLLQKKGYVIAVGEILTRMFDKYDDDCPLKSFSSPKDAIFGHYSDGWRKLDKTTLCKIVQCVDKMFISYISKSYEDGFQKTELLQKIINSNNNDVTKIITKLRNCLRQTLVKTIEYEFY